MRQFTRAFVGAGLALLSLLVWGPVAMADDTVCTGTIGKVTVDNLIVPNGRSCTLNGTRVEGNIIVSTGATLTAKGVDVDGNVQAEGARSVRVLVLGGARSFVGGGVQIEQGGSARIDRVDIDGDLQLFQNRGFLRVTGNDVGGNLQANQNTGGLNIANNIIAENLQCAANNPPPTGGGNTAGDTEDQCANL
jgi:hypothetical protein